MDYTIQSTIQLSGGKKCDRRLNFVIFFIFSLCSFRFLRFDLKILLFYILIHKY